MNLSIEPASIKALALDLDGTVAADMPGARILNSTPLDFAVVDFCIDLARSIAVYYQEPVGLQ
ncbi:MAG: hypothetical protein LBQ88_17575 [Treponema sp.]|nr:hypothetical protein [Treponema sp.]